MPAAKPATFCLLLLAATALLNACGYTMTTRHDGQRPSDAPATQIFFGLAGNLVSAPRPGLEYQLTKRLKSEIAHDRRYELSSNADLKLDVTLIEFQEPAIVRDFDDVQTEVALYATAEVRLRGGQNPRRGKVKAWTSYSRRNGESRQEGLDRLWRELAREVLDFADDYDWLKNAPNEQDIQPDKEGADIPAKG